MYKWIFENSRFVLKTHLITANPLFPEKYRFFPNLYFDEITKPKTIETQHLEKKDEHSQYIDDNLSSQLSGLGLPLNLFHSAFDKVHEHSHASLKCA